MKKIDIDGIEDSLDKVQSVSPDSSFLSKMEELAISKFRPEMKVSYLQVTMIAASLALLIMANILLYNQSGDTATLSDAYNIIPTKLLYNG